MKRTTIFVPEALERDLQLFARRTGKPAAAIVREALAAYIAEKQPQGQLPSFTGSFDSGHTADTAERHDDILFRTLAPAARVRTDRKPARRRAKRRR
jgi:predicted transcriptional regulator